MGNKSNPQAVSLTAIGEKLRLAREKKSLTIDQAQRQTHIHFTVLSALESGRSDEVLTPTYVKSFLKKYAVYLGLDGNQLLKEYLSIHPELESPGVSLNVDNKVINNRADLTDYLRVTKKLVLALACILVLFFAVKTTVSFIKAPHKTSVRKTAVSVKQPRVAAVKKSGAVTAKQPLRNKPDNPQVPQIKIPQDEPIKLNMKVKEQVYVGVKRDGLLLFRRLLPKGTVDTFIADEKLNISIAKARAVELTLNGQSLDSIGKGSIRDLEITRKGIKVK